MDPKANIEEQRALAEGLEAKLNYDEPSAADTARLCELVLALDEWRRGGGFDAYGREPVYVVTREAVEERVGRLLTDDEAEQIGKCIEFSSVDDCIDGAVEQVIG